MRYKVLFHPEDYCIGENEEFYTDQSRRGWRLEKRGAQLSRFVRAEPSDELYRIEIDYSEFDEDKLALYEECGWEFVTKHGYVNVFRASAGAEPPEFYLDPREQAVTVKRMRRRTHITNLIVLVLLIPYLALLLSLGGGWWDLEASLVKMLVLAPGLMAFYLVTLIYAIGIDIEGSFRLRALQRRLKAGRPLDHIPKRRRMLHKWVYILVLALCLGVTAGQLVVLDRGDLPEESDGAYILLRDLGFTGERYYLFGNEDEIRLERVWSPLAEAVQTRESVRHLGSWVSMDQDIYRLRLKGLAKPFADVLIRDSVFARDPSEYRDITVPGWDRVRLASMECVAVRGGDVVHIYMLLPNETEWAEKAEYYARALEIIGERLDEAG